MENSKSQENKTSEIVPEIIRGRFARLTIYEVSDTELETLAQGSPNSIYLNLAIFLLSVSVSFFIALLTASITSNRVFIVFVLITAVGAVGGLVLLCLWLKGRKCISDLMGTIKGRLPPEGIQETNEAPGDSKTNLD